MSETLPNYALERTDGTCFEFPEMISAIGRSMRRWAAG